MASAAGAYLRMLVSSVSVGQLDSPQALRQQDVARRGCSTYCTSAAGVVICSERESPDEHFLEKASALLSRAQAWFGLAGSPGVGLRGGVDHAVLADCLLSACSQQVVDFVAQRLDKGQAPSDVCSELLDTCLASNPREARGIGCDNMTAAVVLLH